MPGKYSPEALAARRLRAIRRGFLVPRAEQGKTSVLVSSPLFNNVKQMVKSLEVHAFNQVALEDCIDECAVSSQLVFHPRANRAKHGISMDVARASSSGAAAVTAEARPLNQHADPFVPAKPKVLALSDLIADDPNPLEMRAALETKGCETTDECSPALRRLRIVERRLETLRKSMLQAVEAKLGHAIRDEVQAQLAVHLRTLRVNGFSDFDLEVSSRIHTSIRTFIADFQPTTVGCMNKAFEKVFIPKLLSMQTAIDEIADKLHGHGDFVSCADADEERSTIEQQFDRNPFEQQIDRNPGEEMNAFEQQIDKNPDKRDIFPCHDFYRTAAQIRSANPHIPEGRVCSHPTLRGQFDISQESQIALFNPSSPSKACDDEWAALFPEDPALPEARQSFTTLPDLVGHCCIDDD